MAKTKTITGYFVDPENNIAEPRTIDKSLEGYYALLRCDCIDMPERRVGWNGGKRFTFICDDEGLLKSPAYVSALNRHDEPALVGPIFAVKFDGREDVTSLTAKDIDYLDNHIETGWTITREGKPLVARVLTGLEY